MQKVYFFEYDSNGNALVKVKETIKPADPELTENFVLLHVHGHGDVTVLLSDTGNVLAIYYYDAVEVCY
jgi:hypothetical protein